MRKSSLALAALAVIALSGTASAASRCRVTDPTGTPLNVRVAPQGAVVGTIGNGRIVTVIDRSSDGNGKPWVYIATQGGHPIGWVFREFVSCY
jgi:hypothetical protein